MEDFLKNLALLLPFASAFIVIVIFVSNQIFNADIEKHLYSNVEKLATHVFNIAVLAGLIMMIFALTSNGGKAPATDGLDGVALTVIGLISLMFLASIHYMFFLLSMKLLGREDYYFNKEGKTYTILKKHKKKTFLCSYKEKEMVGNKVEEVVAWKFFNEEEIFNTVTIKRVPFKIARNKISVEIYTRLRKMKWFVWVFLSVLMLMGVSSTAIPIIGELLKGKPSSSSLFTYYYFGVLFFVSIVLFVMIISRYRAGKILSKPESNNLSTQESEPSV
ncbi:hypothetical protein [Paenilisteria rocourtiae]|uniref:Uncharacterized protein n=1 Tax=Listeria rocourtiae TaxID=647910 RepID=A0A4R6ZSK3_9LIST|nr:hypothetical protein [Listeria rocourtiae]MBC1603582.1 hypothetical protein [Listeria rocourtiae]TDR55129.1 hypothetical protein DFP96_10157 [Listeria rocourtiae]